MGDESASDKTPQSSTDKGPHMPDPLTLYHSDSPSLVLVSQVLDGHNYGQWSHFMRIALSAKNKLGFIDGSIQCPAVTDTTFSIWQRCNDMVLSWIWQSVQSNIARSILYCKTTSAAWKDLEDRFSQGNDSRIYQIQQEIVEHRQGQLSISDYYTQLKVLWDELASYHEPITCDCEGSKTRVAREEKEKVMQFLMGLNETYSTIRCSILMMNPLPDTRRVHGLVLQHERQMNVTSHREPVAHAMQTHRPTIPKGGPASGNFNPHRVPKCSHCDGSHSIDRCYFLIGFPEGHKWHGKWVFPRNKRPGPTAHNVEAFQSQGVLQDETKGTLTNSPTFTTEEYHQLLVLLRSGNGKVIPLANATGHGYEEDDWPGQAI